MVICASTSASEQDQDATMMSQDATKERRRRARQSFIFILRGIAARSLAASALFIAAGLTVPVLADPAPREALPSREAIGWLLETEATGSAAPWVNSRSGYSGTVTVTQTWDRADGAPCRKYTIAALAGGSPTMLKGMGCRVGPGEWNLSEEAPVVLATRRPSPPDKKPAAAAMPSADPGTTAALPTATPADVPPAPLAPVDDDVAATIDPTPARLPADTAEYGPRAIAASLP